MRVRNVGWPDESREMSSASTMLLRRLARALFAVVILSCECTAQVGLASQGTPDRQADVQLLLGLRGAVENWDAFAAANKIGGWNVSTPVCTWTGITCADDGTVVGLNWQCTPCSVPAVGVLPPSLSRLRGLVTLNLQGQSFYGPLPPAWFETDSWVSLQNLYLSGNQLNGTLPPSQPGGMPALTQLRISDCAFTGPIPDTWGTDVTSMRQLSILRAANMHLNGTLPEIWGTAAALPDLVTLDLANNSISGRLPILWANPWAMRFLQELYLQQNQVSGSLPPDYGNATPAGLPNLRYLSLYGNSISGTLPQEWFDNGSWPNLRSLDLNSTGLSGQLPALSPGALPNLNSWRLSYNSLSGRIPPSYANLTQLQRLVLKPGNDGLCGPLPPGLPFQLCDDRDVTCLKTPVALAATCPAGVGPAPELAPLEAAPAANDGAAESPTAGGGGGGSGGGGGGGSSTAAIVGGVVGGVLGCLLLAAAGVLLGAVWLRKRDKGAITAPQPINKSQPSQRPFIAEDGVDEESGNATPSRGSPQGPPSVCTRNSATAPADMDVLASMRSSNVRRRAEQGSALGDPDSSSRELNGSRALSGHAPFSDWEIRPEELEIAKRPDGSDWVIGSGGFGRVFKALRNGVQPAAVKIIPAVGGGRSSGMAEARREVAILRACRDANIVQFQGAFMGDAETILVTEFMDGGDLMHNIRGGRVSWWKRGRKIALDIARGLVFLHSRRIIHFDLKSPNILLAKDGTAKIGDVGMAKFLALDYVTGVVATLAWSAPEMLWGERCSEKADIYSYGIILWEICTGEVPERGRLRDVRVPEECPEEVRQLILECLESRPSLRPSALQIAERLQALPAQRPPRGIAGSSPTAMPQPPSQPQPAEKSGSSGS